MEQQACASAGHTVMAGLEGLLGRVRWLVELETEMSGRTALTSREVVMLARHVAAHSPGIDYLGKVDGDLVLAVRKRGQIVGLFQIGMWSRNGCLEIDVAWDDEMASLVALRAERATGFARGCVFGIPAFGPYRSYLDALTTAIEGWDRHATLAVTGRARRGQRLRQRRIPSVPRSGQSGEVELTRIGGRGMRVFISYSRSQFYLADDLALALRQVGVDAWLDVHRLGPGDDWDTEIRMALGGSECIVLVVSHAALASPYVAAELDLARALGKRVVVALADSCEVPERLSDAPCVDVRNCFDERIGDLVGWLDAERAIEPCDPKCPPGSAMPGVVQLISAALLPATVLLLGTALVTLAVTLARDGAQAVEPSACGALLLGVLCVSLLRSFWRRRRGSLAAVAIALGVTAFVGVPAGAAGLLLWLVRPGPANWLSPLPAVTILSIGTASFVAGVWALRSPTLYRWLPTGDAPRRLRLRMLARRGRYETTQPLSATAGFSYDVSCDDSDRAVAAAIDRAMQERGHQRAHGRGARHQIVVLSNLTPIDWLAATLAKVSAPVVVVSAPVSVDALDHVERYQWVDHRRRSQRTLQRLAATIGGQAAMDVEQPVPESLARPQFPIAVYALSCGFLLVAGTYASQILTGFDESSLPFIEGGRYAPVWSLVAFLLATGWGWGAVSLASRRISVRGFLALCAVLFVAHRATETLDLGDPDAVVVDALAVGVMWLAARGWLPPRAVRRRVVTLGGGDLSSWRNPTWRAVAITVLALTLITIDSVQ